MMYKEESTLHPSTEKRKIKLRKACSETEHPVFISISALPKVTAI